MYKMKVSVLNDIPEALNDYVIPDKFKIQLNLLRFIK